jgi:hypothetical protein
MVGTRLVGPPGAIHLTDGTRVRAVVRILRDLGPVLALTSRRFEVRLGTFDLVGRVSPLREPKAGQP